MWISSDASYTTQPLELLNDSSLENLRTHGGTVNNSDANLSDNLSVQSIENEVVGSHQHNVNGNRDFPSLPRAKTFAEGSLLQMKIDQSEGYIS